MHQGKCDTSSNDSKFKIIMHVLSTGSESRQTMNIQDIHAITSPRKTVKGDFWIFLQNRILRVQRIMLFVDK